MSSMVTLRRRMKSVRSTRQITKAMELISASKMRRAADTTEKSRPYEQKASQILGHIAKSMDIGRHPLYANRKIQTRLHIVIASNRGLSGAYNKNVLQSFAKALRIDQKDGIHSRAILIGRQAGRFATKLHSLEVIGVYEKLPERPTADDIAPVLASALEQFSLINDPADEVVLHYTRFETHFSHVVADLKLLPAGFQADSEVPQIYTLFEPSTSRVLEVVTRRILEVEVLQAYLESQASEQSARMLAMKTASDNAKEIIDHLQLVTNSLRQSKITQELAEITGGAGAGQ